MGAAPASEETLCRYVLYLAHLGLRHATIKAYLSAIHHLHIQEGLGDPFTSMLHRLEYILKGVKRCESEKNNKKSERLPITPPILRSKESVGAEGAGPRHLGSMLPSFLWLSLDRGDDSARGQRV